MAGNNLSYISKSTEKRVQKYWTTGVALLVTLSLWYCSKKTDPMDLPIARVDGLEISQREFLYRTQFFPPPRVDSVNHRGGKSALLELLIAEKLMAIAAREGRLDTVASYREMVAYAEKQAALKEFYRDMIDRNIQVRPQEVQRRLEMKRKKFMVQVFAARKRETAEKFRNRVRSGGGFEDVMREFYGNSLRPQDYTREVTWGEWIDALEKPLYRMREGEISPVIKTPQGFVVMRVVKIRENPLPQDRLMLERMMQKIEKTLRKRKADTLTGHFIESFMNEKNVVVRGEVFSALTHWLDRVLDYKQDGKEVKGNRPRNEVDYDSMRVVFENKLDEPLVTYQGGQFTLRQMLQMMHVRRLDFNTDSPLAMRAQLLSDLKKLVRDELIAREALRKGFHRRKRVQRQVQMWRDYYLSRLFANTAGIKPTHSRRIVLPDTLQKLRERVDIWINQTMLDTVYISPNPMFAVEPGRVTHLVVPPWPVF